MYTLSMFTALKETLREAANKKVLFLDSPLPPRISGQKKGIKLKQNKKNVKKSYFSLVDNNLPPPS